MAPHTSNFEFNSRDSRSATSHRQGKQMTGSQIHWEAGHLAFLTHSDTWNQKDTYNLIKSKVVDRNATNHPCVILQRFQGSDHCLITPVSAFNASEETRFLPPWKQPWHCQKKPEDFRSFRGSESSRSSGSDFNSNSSTSLSCQQLLELRDGRTMPKPKASWIYIQHIYVVPVYLLIPFKKPGQGRKSEPKEPRQLTQASLDTLRAHIEQKCTVFQKQINILHQHRRPYPLGYSSREKPQQQCSSSITTYSAPQHSRDANQTQHISKKATYASIIGTSTSQRVLASSFASPSFASLCNREVKQIQPIRKQATYASAVAKNTFQRVLASSSSSSSSSSTAISRPREKLQSIPAVAPAIPKITPVSLKNTNLNKLQETQQQQSTTPGSR